MATLTRACAEKKRALSQEKSLRPASRPRPRFVELCARSNFSFLQGASHPEEMIEEALRLGYHGMALCDLNGLYGVVRAFQSFRSPSLFRSSPIGAPEFRFHVGCEVSVRMPEPDRWTHLYLLPTNKKSYAHLCQLLTIGKRQAAKGFSQLDWDQIVDHSADLIAFCSSQDYFQVSKVFKDRTHIPVWRDLTWNSVQECRNAFDLESKHQASVFVTQKPLMHQRQRKPLLDVVTCIHQHQRIHEAHSILASNAERFLHDIDELLELWKDRWDLVEKTWEISKSLQFDLSEIRYRYPRSQIPEGLSPAQWLKQKAQAGLHKRYPRGIPARIQNILEHELQIREELEYEDYFLTLDEICDFARQREILHQGRGSAANSVVCYALNLTSVDPTQVDLLFERFISKERGEPPDIDVDFEHQRREEVLQHIYQKYGPQHAAMICTVIRFKSRLALREVAKVFGVPALTIHSVIKFMGRDGFHRLKNEPEVYRKFALSKQKWTLIFSLAQELHGFPRHLGIHTGGFLISQDPITDLVPVEKATMDGRFVIQWNKDDVNFLKLMKIDLLSLGMLSALRRCFDLLRQHKKIDWNLATIPKEDPATYEMISCADTIGVFQIESRAQMNTLPRMQPRNYYDLVVEVALIRPGPLQGGMVHPYLKRRQGKEQITYPHPDLEVILHKTLGVPIFQEQIMKIAIVAAGFTPGEADELRRMMSAAWRRKGSIDGIRNRVLSGLAEKKIPHSMAEQIFRTIEGFGNYGFPESHAASFALLSYASSFLKCHHPDIFFCALLNSQPMGFYPPRSLIRKAQSQGVQVRPACIHFSDWEYRLENREDHKTLEATISPRSLFQPLRVGLCSILGLRKTETHKLIQERDRHGPFASFEEFIQRCPQLSRTSLLRLAGAGVFSCFEPDTRQLLWKIEALSLDPQSFLWGHEKESFRNPKSPEASVQRMDSMDISDRDLISPESNWEYLQREYQYMALSVDFHPLSILRSWLEIKNTELKSKNFVGYSSSQDLAKTTNGRAVRLAGLNGIYQRPPTAKGMCFITLEDEFGFMNIVVPPDVYEKDRLFIFSQGLLEVQGRLQKNGALLHILAQRVLPLRISCLSKDMGTLPKLRT
ncbi:MAG: error-prone DNA polymerase [Bdellovibrio sp.]